MTTPVPLALRRAGAASAAAAARNNSLAAQAQMVFPVLNLWREPNAHPDGSVPGWLEVGTLAFLPPYVPGDKVQSLVDRMPASLRNSRRLFPTIERGGTYTSLKVGYYTLKHSKKKRKSAPGGVINCLQITDHQINQVLIHDAMHDSSTTLKGCIAPGLVRKPPPGAGILDSAEAMDAIWTLLGGYGLGDEVKLAVWSNTPGETRTRETWKRLK